MLAKFGNFRALPIGPVQKAYTQAPNGEITYLSIEGTFLEYVDPNGFPDTPRIPTLWWMNWALAKGKVICASILEQSKTSNVIKLNVSLQLEGTLGQTITFSSENYREPYKQEIMNFILAFSYGGGVGSVGDSIFNFFRAQHPIE